MALRATQLQLTSTSPGHGSDSKRSAHVDVESINFSSVKPDNRTDTAHSLRPLTQMIANATEGYTAAIFRADPEQRTLKLVAAQTLSRDVIPAVSFSFGQGLVGWVAENKTRVMVTPFEYDSTTLMYYSSDQELKSFIAIPIYDSSKELIGVLAVDSKKSYAFSQIAEKILHDCATVAGQFLELADSVRALQPLEGPEVPLSLLDSVIETLHHQKDQRALLSAASDLPNELVEREALIVLSLTDNGGGEGVFYSKGAKSRVNDQLLELVCRHRKIASADKPLQCRDNLGRTFISVPYKVFEREAGSLNLLTLPGGNLSISQIKALEEIASAIGDRLERIRMLTILDNQRSSSDWRSFELRANVCLQSNTKFSLIRFVVDSVADVESLFGAECALQTTRGFARLLEQIRGTDGVLCPIHGTHFLLLVTAAESERVLRRVAPLLEKQFSRDFPLEAINTFASGIRTTIATSDQSTTSIRQLTKRTLDLLADREEEIAVDRPSSSWDW